MILGKEFDKLWNPLSPPGQGREEYRLFLSFVKAYFIYKGVKNPTVLEIGVRYCRQRMFYKKFLNANYIGLDIHKKEGDDFIVGDSHSEKTIELVKSRLDGRKIDLLFIDGDHSYKSARKDLDMYKPLTSYLIAIHDIISCPGVRNLWNQLCKAKWPVIEFKHPQRECKFKDDGLGVILL